MGKTPKPMSTHMETPNLDHEFWVATNKEPSKGDALYYNGVEYIYTDECEWMPTSQEKSLELFVTADEARDNLTQATDIEHGNFLDYLGNRETVNTLKERIAELEEDLEDSQDRFNAIVIHMASILGVSDEQLKRNDNPGVLVVDRLKEKLKTMDLDNVLRQTIIKMVRLSGLSSTKYESIRGFDQDTADKILLDFTAQVESWKAREEANQYTNKKLIESEAKNRYAKYTDDVLRKRCMDAEETLNTYIKTLQPHVPNLLRNKAENPKEVAQYLQDQATKIRELYEEKAVLDEELTKQRATDTELLNGWVATFERLRKGLGKATLLVDDDMISADATVDAVLHYIDFLKTRIFEGALYVDRLSHIIQTKGNFTIPADDSEVQRLEKTLNDMTIQLRQFEADNSTLRAKLAEKEAHDSPTGLIHKSMHEQIIQELKDDIDELERRLEAETNTCTAFRGVLVDIIAALGVNEATPIVELASHVSEMVEAACKADDLREQLAVEKAKRSGSDQTYDRSAVAESLRWLQSWVKNESGKNTYRSGRLYSDQIADLQNRINDILEKVQ